MQAIKPGPKPVQKLSKQVQAAELEATRAAEQRQELLNKQKAAQQGMSRERDLVEECSRLTKLLESVENKRLQQASEQQAEQDRVKDQKAAANDPSELQKVKDDAAAREAEMQEQMSIQMQAQMDAAARELQATKNDFRQRWDQALALFKASTLQESTKHQQAIQKLQLAAARNKAHLEKTTALLVPLKQALLQLNSQLNAPQDQPRDWSAQVAGTLDKILVLLNPVEQQGSSPEYHATSPSQDAQQAFEQAVHQLDQNGNGVVEASEYENAMSEAYHEAVQDGGNTTDPLDDAFEKFAAEQEANGEHDGSSDDMTTPTTPREFDQMLGETGALDQMLSDSHDQDDELSSGMSHTESPYAGF